MIKFLFISLVSLLIPSLLPAAEVNFVGVLEHKYKNYPHTKNDFTISKSFRSASSGKLIQLGFDKPQIDCGGAVEPECYSLWFYLPNEGDPFFIGKKMKLVDGGDYDGDGRSEIVFWKEDYNLDGYVLFYDGLTKKSEYLWGYH